MTDRYAKVSFLASGHVVQDILITDPTISAEELNQMLNRGEAVTTIHEGKEVCVTAGDWDVIGEVVYVEPELEYEEFQLEDDYELPTPQKQFFDASDLALRGAIEEFLQAPDLSAADIIAKLEATGNRPACQSGLEMEMVWETQPANIVLREIDLFAKGLRSLMYVAYQAAKEGKEFI